MALEWWWCDMFHAGGQVKRDPEGRINWQCSCGRWSSSPVPLAEERNLMDLHMLLGRSKTANDRFVSDGRSKFEHMLVQPHGTITLAQTALDLQPFEPASLFKAGGKGELSGNDMVVHFEDGLPIMLEVNGASYQVLSTKNDDLEFIASVYDPENTITVREHLDEAIRRLRLHQP